MKKYLLQVLLSALSYSSVLSAVQTMCPFVGGSAVYKARVLWGLYNPIMQYNDRLVCIQGQNKNGNGGYINIDSLYEAQINEQADILATQIHNNERNIKSKTNERSLWNIDEIQVYPNPATTHIIVSYKIKDDGQFKLYNTLGEPVLHTELNKENTKTQIMINDIANGIYHYEIEFANMKKTIGKLNILK